MVFLFDQFNLPRDVYEIIFATAQQRIVGRVLIDFLKTNGGEINKTEMSYFATKLHEGEIETTLNEPGYEGEKVKLSYNKRQFYDRILTPMKAMGMIDYNLYKKTYKVSNKFAKNVQEIGLLWKSEVSQ